MNTIQVRIKSVYGVDKVYPVCEKAKAFAKLAGQITLTHKEISIIKELGFTINVVTEAVSL